MVLTKSLIVLSTFLVVAQGIHIPLVGTKRSVLSDEELARRELSGRTPSRFFRRAEVGSETVNNSQDFQYSLNITLAGAPYTVSMDTGSSDLWVASELNSAFVITTFEAEVDFVIGSAKGPVMTADLDFSGLTIPDQAFIFVTPSQQQPVGQGLIGLGPFSGSKVLAAVNDVSANPALDRAFQQETATETFITVELGRASDPETAPTGSLTVGEVLQQYSSITSSPKLPVPILPPADSVIQHWQALSDSNGISVNGKAITTPSNASLNIDPNSENTLSFIFDTGFTLPQVPAYISDGIYQDVSGAVKQNINGLGEIYVLPCDAEVNITFSFGGQTIPIHPLDANVPGFQDNNGNDICVGSFQPVLPGVQSPFEDGNLGMAFLRNVYMLINFGSLAQGAPAGTADPYIQFLPLTDPAKAHQDFVNERVNTKTGTSTSSGGSSGSATKGASSPSSTAKKSGAGRLASSSTAMILSGTFLVLGVLSHA